MRDAPLDPRDTIGLEPEQLPRHIAIIMDGNGRWARQRGLPRINGHAEGAKAVRAVVTYCARLGIEALTLYSFSSENWKRPRAEVDFLMELYGQYLIAERGEITENNVRLIHIGRREGLPASVLGEMDTTVALSRDNSGLKLCLALNYGSRDEIVSAVKRIAGDIRDGRRSVDDIDEQLIGDSLQTAGVRDPDLLIRTAGEFRVSNFLLWQISYAEIVVTPRLWPEFTVDELNAAIIEFARRERRYGDVAPRSAPPRTTPAFTGSSDSGGGP
ncbi:MAG: isoprenyl transferase [Phycisphaerales bacterium]|nr:isoprenyl transferase [Phycisphaerales bacterium]